MTKRSCCRWLCMFGLLSFSILQVRAQSATVSLLPNFQRVPVGGAAEVRLHVEDIENLHAYSVHVVYDPRLARCERVESLGALGDELTFFAVRIDSAEGTIAVDEALLGLKGWNGSGDLIEFRFVGLAFGTMELLIAGAQFRDTNNTAIPVITRGASVSIDLSTDVHAPPSPPSSELWVSECYPNPFNSETSLRYHHPPLGAAMIRIFSMLGEEVLSVEGENESSIETIFRWNGKSESGAEVASGLYMLFLETNGAAVSRKLLLVR